MTHTRRSRLLRACGFAAACLALAAPSSAFAFSDASSFANPALLAGGGGRYFTGSPADAYTCRVCHSGGEEPMVAVVGLPINDGYRLSTRYELRVDWDDEVEGFATAVEITDANGKPAGTLQLPPEDELEDQEFCAPASVGVPAASLNDASEGRQVINIPDCGAKRLRFLWTTPDTDVGPIWFAGSSIVSDRNADVFGDGVTDFARVIGSRAATRAAAKQDGCSVTAPVRAGMFWQCFGLASVVLGYALRRARRNANPQR